MAMRLFNRGATATITALIAAAACVVAPSAALAGDGGNGNGGSGNGNGGGSHRPHALTDQVILEGGELEHVTSAGGERLTGPDDITILGGRIFVAFQNGVGPQGEASATGNVSSTVVELSPHGHAIAQWDVIGHCDGLTADPETGQVIGTVNEDANSSLFTIEPRRGEIVHYSYSEPLPSDGGTDAISIYHRMILISASAPGTTGLPAPQPGYPAVYEVSLQAATQTAVIAPLFYDEASATLANAGSDGETVTLKLTDPDSNEVVPFYAPRFGDEFMLTSQGDQEQVFVQDAGAPDQSLSVLRLSTAVDDTAWPTPSGTLYATDGKDDTVNRVVGPFERGSVLVAATPCDSNGAPSECPAAGYPANYLGELDPWTGEITPAPLTGPQLQPKGLLFLPSSEGQEQ